MKFAVEDQPKFLVEIELGNEAMLTADDIARTLYALADKIIESTGSDPLTDHAGLFRNIRDYNGNTVGLWRISK